MKSFGRTYALSGGIAVSLLAGCGESQPPIGASGAMPQTYATAPRVAQRPSWMKFSSDPVGAGSFTYVSQMWPRQTSVSAYPTNDRENGGPYL